MFRNIPLCLIDIMSEYQVLGCKFCHRILIFMDEVLHLLLRGPNAFLTSDALYLVFSPPDCCKVSSLFGNFLVYSSIVRLSTKLVVSQSKEAFSILGKFIGLFP